MEAWDNRSITHRFKEETQNKLKNGQEEHVNEDTKDCKEEIFIWRNSSR